MNFVSVKKANEEDNVHVMSNGKEHGVHVEKWKS